MKDSDVYRELIGIAVKLGIEIKEEKFSDEIYSAGGLYKLRDRNYFLLNIDAPYEDKIKLLINEIKKYDTETIYIPPMIRERYFQDT